MVEAWSVVGFMVWGLRMVCIYRLQRSRQTKYRDLWISCFPHSVVLKKSGPGNRVMWACRYRGVFCMCFMKKELHWKGL